MSTRHGFLQDVRYGLRSLARARGFSAMAVAVLAIGIGANATIFSVANAFLLRPLPVVEPETLIRVYSNRYSTTGYGSYVEYRDGNATLSGLAGFQMRSLSARVDRETEHVFGEVVSGNYFPTTGVAPAGGRLLTPADDREGAPPVAVLSHAFWTRRFGASPDAIGRTVALNDHPFTIVGVAPDGFRGLLAPLAGDFWVPLATDALLREALDPATRRETMALHLIGRLKPGTSPTQAQVELDTIGRRLRAASGQSDHEPAITVYRATTLSPEFSTPVTVFALVLMTAVTLLLLVVCVNVANLVLARATSRSAELAIRQSLGASRGQVVRQLLTESLLLSMAGGVAGLVVAFWSTRLLMSVPLPIPVPIALDLSIDARVVVFTMLVAIVATLASGVAPALTASRVDLVSVLKSAGSRAPRHGRLRRVFLIAQVSMSVLLLIAAGLLVRSVVSARSIGLGFDTAHVLTASIDLETRGYTKAQGVQFLDALVQRLEAASNVVAANVVDMVPVTLSNRTGHVLRDGDPELPPDQRPPNVYENAVGPGHFRTLQIELVAGRDFANTDDERGPAVAIVNETLARRFWPKDRAVGQRVRLFSDVADARRVIEIVGVVRDSTYIAVGESPRASMYRPLAQAYTPHVTLLVRGAGALPPLSVIQSSVTAGDPGLAAFNVTTLGEATAASLLPAQAARTLLVVLGIFSLILSSLGIYGVLSFIVGSRTSEIGLRLALGAAPRAVAGLVVRQAMTWVACGIAIGLALAVALTRFLDAFLFGISPTDAWTFAGVVLLFLFVACTAALLPAVQASRLDPLSALRTP